MWVQVGAYACAECGFGCRWVRTRLLSVGLGAGGCVRVC